jgi:predicted nucleic acid-binding protein
MIVADTGAILALLDAGDRHHDALKAVYAGHPGAWVLPWAILPEVDYLAGRELGDRAQRAFLADLADGGFSVEWGTDDDLAAAARLDRRYRTLRLGLVDAIVIACAERLRADAIATLDVRHFGAVTIKGSPRLLPRDL